MTVPDDQVSKLPLISDEQVRRRADEGAKEALYQEIIMTERTSQKTPQPSGPAPLARRRRLVVAFVAGLLVMTAAGVYAGGGYLSESDPDSPWVDVADLAEVARRVGSDVPFPPGRSLDEVIAVWEDSTVLEGTIQETGISSMVAFNAVCLWKDQWLQAVATDDDDAASAAIAAVEDSGRWPEWGLVNADTAFERAEREVALMKAGAIDDIAYDVGLNCLPELLSVPPAEPTVG